MKRLILILFTLAATLALNAQNTGKFYDVLVSNYADKDGFSASMLSQDMFDLYLKKKNVDKNSEVAAALKKLDRIMVVSQSGYTGPTVVAQKFDEDEYRKQEEANKKERDSMYDLIVDHYRNDNFTLLKTEKRMGEDVKVFLKKSNEKVTSLVLLTNSSAATSLVELNGDIDLANVASLSSAMNLRGLENLYKIDNSGAVTVVGYPRASYFSQERIAEMEARAREMAERQAKLSEEQIKRIEEQAELQAKRQMEMAEKQRQMAEIYQRQPIFLNYPGDSTIYYLDGKKVAVDEIKNIDKSKIKSINVNKTGKDDIKMEIHISTK